MARRSGTRRSASISRSTAGAPGGSGNGITIICSECYLECSYDPSSGGESIVCPCEEHSCDRPDEAQVHRVMDLAKKEKVAFLINAGLLFAFLGSGFFWMKAVGNPAVTAEADAAMFYGPVGVAVLCLLGLLIFGLKYESSRWETYY